jgi:hypothetical protein
METVLYKLTKSSPNRLVDCDRSYQKKAESTNYIEIKAEFRSCAVLYDRHVAYIQRTAKKMRKALPVRKESAVDEQPTPRPHPPPTTMKASVLVTRFS